MRQLLAIALAIGVGVPAASATDLTLRVLSLSNGTDLVTAAPGASVPYKVVGVLSDTLNEGLALVGFDLVYTCGGTPEPLTEQASLGASMSSFEVPDGICNPAGCGGTMIDGILVQVGAGQNTIKNFFDNAPFPIGIVELMLGHTELVIATGNVTFPGDADCVLSIPQDSVFANVITEGEVLANIFLATEAAGTQPTGALTITGDVDPPMLTASEPACGASLSRSANNFMLLTFNKNLTAPNPGDILIEQLQAGGEFGSDLSSSFSFTVENDDGGNPRVLRIEETAAALSHGTWVSVRNTGGWATAQQFEVDYRVYVGDVNNDGLVLSQDAGIITLGVPCFSNCDPQLDVNGDGLILSQDAGIVTLNVPFFGVSKPEGHGCVP